MSELLEKSRQSLLSAKSLVKETYYSSTVNRSYYACFQFILHILFTKIKKDPTEFYNEVQNGKNGTHTWASKLISYELAKKDMIDYKWFQGHVPALKERRVNADYYQSVISQEEGYKAISEAENIINLLVKNFK
ncbi:HEPN domain-containing protein [Ferruginibacter sp. HRS2-29]|uniref:HEPN domain-containing protein n=1 Tax=Ferruginibacter sp. HRS2-29 TaxID=2487334 RepID=UPI0020CC28C1|nr:HEPN domain-containing protein [Ferruginibacter sp. HRS2-29]MCP9751393.1 HEPN domain-containing protein [Ferruginibacter sp. HRS2-29]